MNNIITMDGSDKTLSEREPFHLVYVKGGGWVELEYNGVNVNIINDI